MCGICVRVYVLAALCFSSVQSFVCCTLIRYKFLYWLDKTERRQMREREGETKTNHSEITPYLQQDLPPFTYSPSLSLPLSLIVVFSFSAQIDFRVVRWWMMPGGLTKGVWRGQRGCSVAAQGDYCKATKRAQLISFLYINFYIFFIQKKRSFFQSKQGRLPKLRKERWVGGGAHRGLIMSADEMKYAFFIYMCAVVARSIRASGVGEVKRGWGVDILHKQVFVYCVWAEFMIGKK